MTNFAFPLPDKLVARLSLLPSEKVEAMSGELAEIIEEILDEESEPEDGNRPGVFPTPLRQEDLTRLSPATIASIQRGIDDSDAGRVTDGDTFFARLFERVGLPSPTKESVP